MPGILLWAALRQAGIDLCVCVCVIAGAGRQPSPDLVVQAGCATSWTAASLSTSVQGRRFLLQGLPGVRSITPCLRIEQASCPRGRQASGYTHSMRACMHCLPRRTHACCFLLKAAHLLVCCSRVCTICTLPHKHSDTLLPDTLNCKPGTLNPKP